MNTEISQYLLKKNTGVLRDIKYTFKSATGFDLEDIKLVGIRRGEIHVDLFFACTCKDFYIVLDELDITIVGFSCKKEGFNLRVKVMEVV